MKQRARPVRRVERRQKVHEARQRRQAAEPSAAASFDPEVQRGAEDVDAVRIRLEERDRRLRQDERDVSFESVAKSFPVMSVRIVARRQIDEHVIAMYLDREPTQVVCPLVERPARAEVEAGVMPVAREDPVGDRAAVEREPHVWAAVVNRVHVFAFGEKTERVTVDVDDEPAVRAKLSDRGRADEPFFGNCGHARSLELQVMFKSSAGG